MLTAFLLLNETLVSSTLNKESTPLLFVLKPEKKTWEKLKEQYKFDQTPLENETGSVTQKNKEPENQKPIRFAEVLVFILIFLTLLSVIAILLKRKNQPPIAQKPYEPVDISENPENIDIDFSRFIQEALDAKNYKMAIRITYLNLLKMLQEYKILKWHKHFTNQNYIEQLKGTVIQNDFEQFTRIYESSWYGNYSVNENKYLIAKQMYTETGEQLNQLFEKE